MKLAKNLVNFVENFGKFCWEPCV